MEAQLEDIRNETTLNNLRQFKSSIIDCTKYIKSNDQTFKISTLQNAADEMTDLMSNYVEYVHKLEAVQNAFIRIQQEIEEEAGGEAPEEIVQLESVSNRIKATIEQETNNHETSEVEAQLDLDKVLRIQEEEEIQVEAPTRQIPKDPITKKTIKIAVKSNICGHIYDKDGIEDYFKQKELANKTRIQCPQAGCTNKRMTRSELVMDEETNRLIQSL